MNRRQSARAIDAPEPCFVRLRTSPRGPWLPARIVQRLGHLTADIEGAAAEVDQVWTSGELITEREWLDLTRDRHRAPPF